MVGNLLIFEVLGNADMSALGREKRSFGSHQLPLLIFTQKKEEPRQILTHSWETREMHAFF